MNKRKLNMLSKELRQAGAGDAEATSLLLLAGQLRQLPAETSASGLPLFRLPRFPGRLAIAGLGGFFGLLIGASLVIFSQNSLPGGWLYPVKQLSEQAAVAVEPNYKATIMMHRAQEVQSLVARHETSQRVLATLVAYQQEAAAYKSSTSNYSAFEYCKTSLQQAAAHANAQERQAIQATLASLQTV